MGLVSLTVIVNVVGAATSGDSLGVNPEKKPPFKGTQGSWKLDSTTECFWVSCEHDNA